MNRRQLLKGSLLGAAALVLPTDDEVRRFWPGFGPGTNARAGAAPSARAFTLQHQGMTDWDAAWLEMTRPRPPWREVVLAEYATRAAASAMFNPELLDAAWAADPDEGTDRELRRIVERDKNALWTADMLAAYPRIAEGRMRAQGLRS